MKYLFFLLYAISLFANTPIVIDANTTRQTLKCEILNDEKNILDITQVVNNSNFKQNLNSDISHINGAIWTKISIINKDTSDVNLIFQNLRAGLDFIDVYIIKNNQLSKRIELGDMREQSKRDIIYKNSAFMQTFEPNVQYTIYTKLTSYGQYHTTWDIMSIKEFAKIASLESILWGFFGGILLTIIMYNIVIYLSLRNIYILIYLLNAVAIFIFQYAINGIFYQFNLGLNLEFITIIGSWVFPQITVGLSLLFTVFFFDISRHSKPLFYSLLTCATISFLFAALFLYGFIDKNILKYSAISTPIAMISLGFAFLIGIWAFKQKLPGAIYYIIGQGVYLTCLIYDGAIVMSYLPLYEYSVFVMPIAIFLNALLLALALASKIRYIKLENQRNAEILAQKARFFSIGQSVGNITHQWKNPINHLSSELLLLEATLNLQKDNFIQKFQEILPHMQISLDYIKNSINDFYEFYSNSNIKADLNPSKEIDTVLRILKEKISLNSIIINITDNYQNTIYAHKSQFLSVIMIILENAIWQLINNNIKEPKIKITLSKSDNYLEITICDNGGGIAINPIESIFDTIKPSTKKDGCGLGLGIAKQIMNERFNGTINATNYNEGACFKLHFL